MKTKRHTSENIPFRDRIVVKDNTTSTSLSVEHMSVKDISETTAEMCCNEVVRLLIIAASYISMGVCYGNDPNRFEDCEQNIHNQVSAYIDDQILRRIDPKTAMELEALDPLHKEQSFEIVITELTPTVSEKNVSSEPDTEDYTVSTTVDFRMPMNRTGTSAPCSFNYNGCGRCPSTDTPGYDEDDGPLGGK